MFIHIFYCIYYDGEIKDLRVHSRFSIVSFSFNLNQDNSTFKRLLFIFNFVIYSAFPVSEYSHKKASAFPPMKQSIRGIMAQLRNWKDSRLSAKFSQWVAEADLDVAGKAYSFLSFEKAFG